MIWSWPFMSAGSASDETPRRREQGMALVLGASREKLFGLCGKNWVASQLESQSSWGVLECFLCLRCDCKGSNGAWNWMHNIVKLRVAKQQCSRRFSLSDDSPLRMLSSQLSSDNVLIGQKGILIFTCLFFFLFPFLFFLGQDNYLLSEKVEASVKLKIPIFYLPSKFYVLSQVI